MARSLLLPGDRPLVHLALLAATVGTTIFAGSQLTQTLPDGVFYGLAAVAILGTHEMGHYVFARIHGVNTTLPYFIPIPLGFGTLGAVIRIRSPIPTRNALVDIGAAGPLAGLAVAIPLLAWGISQSTVVDAPVVNHTFPTDQSLIALLGTFAEYLWTKMSGHREVSSQWSGMGIIYGHNLLMEGLIRFIHGPIPPGRDLLMHPLVMASWFGMVVTVLNLCPIGQLDGGHLTFAMFGEGARAIGKAVAALLLFLVLCVSVQWILWLLIAAKVIGFGHPEVVQPAEPLSFGRKLVCFISFIALALCFIPMPIQWVLV